MAKTIEIKVPDIGMDKAPVIEVLVAKGDTVSQEDGLITLESDKATMDVPAPEDGVITELKVAEGDEVAEGDVIAVLEVSADAADESSVDDDAQAADSADSAAQDDDTQDEPEAADSDDADDPAPAAPAASEASAPSAASVDAPTAADDSGKKADITCQLVVLGSGPGGYSAAFRAADLGLDTVLIERYDELGGVCLNVGCIPSKALLHAAQVMDDARSMQAHGIHFGEPEIDLEQLRDFKSGVVGKLTAGIAGMAKSRKVKTVHGTGRFVSPYELEVESSRGTQLIRFEKAIIAAGSESLKLPGFPWDDERIMDSTGALALQEIPKKLLVVGGGIIGLEMATVYAALGSEVTVVELADQIIPGADKDLVKPLLKRLKAQLKGLHLETRVVEAKAQKNGIMVSFEGKSEPDGKLYDRVLVAVGRAANGNEIGAENAGVAVSERGLIAVDTQMRTNMPHIFAIGDIVGQPMLAHKATHEAHIAAEVCAEQKSYFDARVIPSVAYTNPEIAWVGVTERQAKADEMDIEVAKFPWAASGRALGIDRAEGFTKLVVNKQTQRVIGAGIVGVNAGELISELALAIEMDCEVADIALTIHPHPTLGESVALAAQLQQGTITDLYVPKKKKK